ncbi:hypothetical protein KP509_31G031800 [Ceratopteris richardii]|nr:hypothetical protein KP509_31G031800 [Ceratopteris richardii]
MYAKCGQLGIAYQMLHINNCMDVFAWTDVITAFNQKQLSHDALTCYEQMQHRGIDPDGTAFACAMNACCNIRAVDKGEKIYSKIYQSGLLACDIVLGTSVVDMFVKCGALKKAQQVHEDLPQRNVVSWTSLMTGYAQRKYAVQTFKCFQQMLLEGLSPNAMTFVCILKVCGISESLSKGEDVHNMIVQQELLNKDIVLSTAIVDMYSKCGAFAKAYKVLRQLPVKNIPSWNALISGYVQQGLEKQALSSLELMQLEGLCPNEVTFLCILKACGNLGAVKQGEYVHDEIVRQGFLSNNILLGNALVHMYSKCGALEKAQQVLMELCVRDIASWNSLILGYAKNGQAGKALSCLEQMGGIGLSLDDVTSLCILKACSTTGMIKNAGRHILNLKTKHDAMPNAKHFTCIMDALGRAGYLDSASKCILDIQDFKFSEVLYASLLSACAKWGEMDIGWWACEFGNFLPYRKG